MLRCRKMMKLDPLRKLVSSGIYTLAEVGWTRLLGMGCARVTDHRARLMPSVHKIVTLLPFVLASNLSFTIN